MFRFFIGSLTLLLLVACGNDEPPTSINQNQASGEPAASPVQPSESMAQVLDDTALEHAAKHLDERYVCPMHPQIVRDEPGNCPICGMDLVARQVKSNADKYAEVAVAGAMQQSLGLRTATVGRDTLWRYIRTVGHIEYDERLLTHLHPRAEGWMEQLSVRAEGDEVKAGQKLGEFYSKEILAAQVDFLLAQNASNRDNARNRLRLFGVTDDFIRELEKTKKTRNRVPVNAPASGIITKLGARQGMFVPPSMELFTIADLSRVWVQVDIFEHQMDWVQVGNVAEITVPAFPGKTWEGRIEYIYPELDAMARTLRLRLVFDNPDLQLRPNMFAQVTIYGGPKHEALVIPKQALIVTGQRKAVIKRLGENRFKPVDVVTGMHSGDQVEILNGLKQDDEIVVSGQFLIDSESSLQASFSRLSGE
ncbi:MAG: efflux RND transporter periplasmic adaptor subunit [Chromatiales bacterium]|jgi:Cu(I)/Ag(I) efflux system membrane fusion protein